MEIVSGLESGLGRYTTTGVARSENEGEEGFGGTMMNGMPWRRNAKHGR